MQRYFSAAEFSGEQSVRLPALAQHPLCLAFVPCDARTFWEGGLLCFLSVSLGPEVTVHDYRPQVALHSNSAAMQSLSPVNLAETLVLTQPIKTLHF